MINKSTLEKDYQKQVVSDRELAIVNIDKKLKESYPKLVTYCVNSLPKNTINYLINEYESFGWTVVLHHDQKDNLQELQFS